MLSNDPVRLAFTEAAGGANDDERLQKFIGRLRSDNILHSERDARLLENLWPTQDFNRMAKALLPPRKGDGAYSALSALRAGTAQLQTITSNYEGDPLILSQLLQRCADAQDAMKRCETDLLDAIRKTAISLENERLASIVPTQVVVDPFGWQSKHVLDVEKAASFRRVCSLNHIRWMKNSKDPWGLTASSTSLVVKEAQVVCSDGKERSAYVVELTSERNDKSAQATASAKKLMWQTYAAHRCLAAAPRNVPHALGWFDDHPGDEARRARTTSNLTFGTRLVYERPRALPLRIELKRARSHLVVASSAPLVRHWIREVLARAAEIETMSTHEIVTKQPFDVSNLWVAEHGAALRIGNLKWGAEISAAHRLEKLRNRSRGLLAGFANVAEEIIATLCVQGDDPSSATRVFREEEARAGMCVSPGQRVEIVLSSPADPSLRWRSPLLTEKQSKIVSLNGEQGVALNPIVPGGGQVRLCLTALRPGVVEIPCRCSSTDVMSTTTSSLDTTINFRISVAVNFVGGPLRAILRWCRLVEFDKSSPNKGDSDMPVLAPSALLSHNYFTPLTQDELVDAMSTYERVFLANPEIGDLDEETVKLGNTGLCSYGRANVI